MLLFFFLNNKCKSCGELETWVKVTKMSAIKTILVILYTKPDQNSSNVYACIEKLALKNFILITCKSCVDLKFWVKVTKI